MSLLLPLSLSLSLSLFLPNLCTAQSILYPTTALPSATPLPSYHGYTYTGCYNETTGFASGGNVRALADGNATANNSLTAESCLDFCAGGRFALAGLEYGRECYCASYLSVLSTLLSPASASDPSNSSCHFACNGNSSQICGGSDALSLYNLTDPGQLSTGTAWRLDPGMQAVWFGTAAVLMLGVGAVI